MDEFNISILSGFIIFWLGVLVAYLVYKFRRSAFVHVREQAARFGIIKGLNLDKIAKKFGKANNIEVHLIQENKLYRVEVTKYKSNKKERVLVRRDLKIGEAWTYAEQLSQMYDAPLFNKTTDVSKDKEV